MNKQIMPESLTRALLLVAGADLLSGTIAGMSLEAVGLAQPEAALHTGVAGFAAEAPVVPAAPVTPACNRSRTWPVSARGWEGHTDRPTQTKGNCLVDLIVVSTLR